jgi:hypothetical protein
MTGVVSLFFSIFIHVFVVGTLIYLSHSPFEPQLGEDQVVKEEEAKLLKSAPMELKELHFYNGISYTEFSKRLAKENVQKKSSALLGKLQNMNFGKGGPVVEAPSQKGNDINAPQVKGLNGKDTLTAMVDRQKLNFKEPETVFSKNSTRKMSDKERAELRKKFKALESEFRKAYGRALTTDPHLNVTVAFEAEIQPTGYLALSSFKAQGSYVPQSLVVLKNEMSTLIGKVYVTKDLSGARIRGESVFVR